MAVHRSGSTLRNLKAIFAQVKAAKAAKRPVKLAYRNPSTGKPYAMRQEAPGER